MREEPLQIGGVEHPVRPRGARAHEVPARVSTPNESDTATTSHSSRSIATGARSRPTGCIA
jgi:hypothetical protein